MPTTKAYLKFEANKQAEVRNRTYLLMSRSPAAFSLSRKPDFLQHVSANHEMNIQLSNFEPALWRS